jgi:very-long-chain (3R)-3-hydroxyacyl-CoA dehydratase
MFIVLYPIGILSEMWLVYQVIVPSKDRNTLYQYLLYFGLAIYLPGASKTWNISYCLLAQSH